MNDEQTPDDIESQVAAFAAELDGATDVNAQGLHSDVVKFLGLLLAAPDRRAVSSAVIEFSAAAQSKAYVCLVFDRVITSWALWVLHEGNPGLFAQYTRHLQIFILSARAMGVTSITEADSESFGGSAENGQSNV